MLEIQEEKIPGSPPVPSADDPIEELDKYNRQMDELIEDAEIEAELEAAKKIRSKNTRLFTISVIAVVLLGFIYVKTQNLPPAPTGDGMESPLSDLAEELLAQQVPILDETGLAPDLPASSFNPLSARPAQAVEAPAAPKKPEKLSPKPLDKPASKPKIARAKSAPKNIKSASKPVVPKAAASQRSPGKQYSIQLGAFSVRDNADRLVKKLALKGFKPDNYSENRAVTKFAVTLGSFPDKEQAAPQGMELAKLGFFSSLEKNGDGTFKFMMGSFKSKKEANALKSKLKAKGFLSSIKRTETRRKIHFVRISGFSARGKARLAQEKLTRLGFKNSFIR
ncbi:MAG: SPOR domain-containing protein [Nitrospinaceae bacterium]